MNSIFADFRSNAPLPVNEVVGLDPTAEDATAQALLQIGLLGLLASKYSALEAKYQAARGSDRTAIRAEMDAILATFNQIEGYYQLSGDTLTFKYNEGAQSIQLTDPTLIKLVQTMPSTPDKFTIFWADPTDTPAVAIMSWLQQDKLNYETASPVTKAMALFFMLSTEVITTGKMAGVAAQFINIQRLFPNQLIISLALCAFLHNDKTLNPDVIADCLNIDDTTGAYKEFSDLFSANYKEWVKNPIIPESGILFYEMLYWPEYPTQPQPTKVINAAPLGRKPNNEPRQNVTHELGIEEFKRNKRENLGERYV